MDGVLLIDKPQGPTSHDVVARMRRASGERAIGHTGTLDPQATGLLALVLGRATRLAALLTGSDKTYEATVRLGFATDTDDATGEPLGGPAATLPADEALRQALLGFTGTFAQRPPRYSAKKVGGRKAYELARRDEPVELAPVSVTVRGLDWTDRTDDRLALRVTASSGFYVRALARDLGDALGCGAHLLSLRRTASGSFRVDQAIPLDEAERLGAAVASRLIAPAEALPELVAVELTDLGLRRAVHGNPLGPEHLARHVVPPSSTSGPIRLVAADGRLVGLARSRGGSLHPVVVLG